MGSVQGRPESLETGFVESKDIHEAEAGPVWPEYPMHKPMRSYESFRVDCVPGMPAHEADRIRQIGTLLYNMLLAFNPDAREALVITGLFARSVGMNISAPLALGKDRHGKQGYRGFAGEAAWRRFVEHRESLEKLVIHLTDAAFAAGQMKGVPDMVTGALLLWLVAGKVYSRTVLALTEDLAQRETRRGEADGEERPQASGAEEHNEATTTTDSRTGGAPGIKDATGSSVAGP